MTNKIHHLILGIVAAVIITSCNDAPKPVTTDIAADMESLRKKTSDLIKTTLEFSVANEGKLDDSLALGFAGILKPVYDQNLYNPLWSYKERWRPQGDSLLYLIKHAKLYGLFPEDYFSKELESIQARFSADTADTKDRKDAALWSRADLLLSDAFLRMAKDVKLGRIPSDSITLRKDTLITDSAYVAMLDDAQKNHSISRILNSLEPKHQGYQLLKAGLANFLKHEDSIVYTQVLPATKVSLDSFNMLLAARLQEAGFLQQDSTFSDSTITDSLRLAKAVKAYQKEQGLNADGKAGAGTLRMLNMTDHDKFIRIAISMDRYKLLPDSMPLRYIWVNLPGYYMKLREGDSVKFTSKVICGKPLTRTPLLTSSISEMITYPQWTPPNSIIVKEILPGLKKDPGYLARKGFSLLDARGDEVDPYTVDWAKYNKGIPYRVVQGSGDANSLGILKFNFPNKYAVYLHDTNQRYLFGQNVRSLSHGCVRVQDWNKLAKDIIRYDNKARYEDIPSPTEDSLNAWLTRKEKHSIYIKNRLPVYIRYFTCEGNDGKLTFYDDIYSEDKYLQEKFFAGK